MPLPRSYRRREPEKSALYALVRDHLETFLEEGQRRTEHGFGYPAFVEKEFRGFLRCGIVSEGFARVRCGQCGHELFVALSCKRRGACPSCSARRTAETAVFLVDRLLPEAPYRQWVLTVPFPVRMLMARDKTFLSAVLLAFLRVLFAYQRRQAHLLGFGKVKTGSVTFVQRAGSAVNPHPHFHSLLPDAVFAADDDGGPCLIVLPAPTVEELLKLTRKIAQRVTRLYHDRCEGQGDVAPGSSEPALEVALEEATRTPLPLFPSSQQGEDGSSGQDAVRPTKARSLSARVDGFSLHAGTHVRADDREGLEYLCRYGARGPFSLERLSLLPDGRVRYALRRPWPTAQGVTSLTFEPLAFLRRLALLIPPPYQHLVRYHGIFGPNSRWHPRVPESRFEVAPDPAEVTDAIPPSSATPVTREPSSERREQAPGEGREQVPELAAHRRGASSSVKPPSLAPSGEALAEPPALKEGPGSNSRYIPWADLLRRVFAFEVLVCGRCSGPMTVISYLTDPKVLEKILTHLGLPTCAPATAPARCLDAEAPELDFEDPTDPPVRPLPTAARSPPEPKGQVDVDDPTDDDGGFWGA